MKKENDSFRVLEGDIKQVKQVEECIRVTQDFSGYHWLMEHMRPGQGIEEGIHLLQNELSGNDFSWNTGCVPGDVYTDLYRAGELDDPIVGRNMAKAKWVQDMEWWYTYAFNITEEMEGKDLTLIFEGVDYSCDVWLNGVHLGAHTGMMSSFKFDVTNLIDTAKPHVPSNLITLKLDPPPKNQKNIAGMKHNFAGDYLTGLVPFGIWRPVKLIATKDVRIEDYRLDTKVIDGAAQVEIEVDVYGIHHKNKKAYAKVQLKHEEQLIEVVKEVEISKGVQKLRYNLLVEDAKLWWPYELGNPDLYELTISLYDDETGLDEIKEKVGLREITTQMNPGFTEEESEIPWTFVINGKPMFLRSACWGGQPSFFYGRNTREKYQFYLEKAKECHINNLRIFGWHPAETKDFYQICDELGITVWTNFSFATQVFREDKEYLDAVYKECGEIVKDRRNHASNIVWMGGEEVFFSEAHVKSGNKDLMKAIGRIVNSLTNVPYRDASPLSSREGIRMGYKTKESVHANSHYYAAGAIFMEDYYTQLDCCIIPELTAASSPNVESLKKFIPENELWPIGPSWGYHAADLHILEILNYEVFGSKKNDTLEEFVEATQIAQGTIFQYALEHFRRCKPHVSGVALCHFITNWPIIKWDIVDYYGEKKKSFDFVQTSYQPLLPTMAFAKRRWLPEEIFEGKLWVVNDYYKEYEGVTYSYEIISATGETVVKEECKVDISSSSSKEYQDVKWKVQGEVGSHFDIKLTLRKGAEILATNEYRILILDQEEAKKKAMELYIETREIREKYGRGYYRYTPEMLTKNL